MNIKMNSLTSEDRVPFLGLKLLRHRLDIASKLKSCVYHVAMHSVLFHGCQQRSLIAQ